MHYRCRIESRRQARAHRCERGFTLLELLVVLAIVALAAALIAPALVVAPRPPKPELISFLEEQRRRAIESGAAVSVFYRDGSLRAGPGEGSFALPEGHRLSIAWPRESEYLKERLITVFYPDGTAMLGRFRVVRGALAGREVEVLSAKIHPIFGEVIYAFP